MIDTPKAQTGSVLSGLYLDLLAGIRSGEYPPKSTLPTEGRLARDYGISRSVVRSALKLLKQRGIIRSRQGSGTVVACPDPRKLAMPNFTDYLPNLRDCYACRLAIEPEISAQLAVSRSESATAYLDAQLKHLEQQADSDAQPDNLETARDAEFHVRLAEHTENRFFSSIMAAMRPHLLFSMNIEKYLIGSAQKNHAPLSRLEHRAIIRAILDRDASAAHRSMRRHIANARDRFFLEGPGKERPKRI